LDNNFKKKILRNSSIGVILLICTTILTLLSVPVFISKLGMELYGAFAILSVVGNLGVFTNLGLNQALIVYLAKQGKSRESNYDIAVSALLLGLLASILGSIIIFYKYYIIQNILGIPNHLVEDSQNLLVYFVFANSLMLVGQIFTSIIDSAHKIYLTNICQFLYNVFYWGGMILVISYGGGLSSIGYISIISAIFWFVLVAISGILIWKDFNIDGLNKNIIRIIKKQFGYGSKIYLTGLVGFLFEPISKVLVSNYLGLNIVGVFEIALKIRNQISNLLMKGLYPLFPFLASVESGEKLNFLVNDLSKKLQLIIIPTVVSVIFMMPIILEVWLDEEKNLDTINLFVIILTSSFLLFSPSVFPIYFYFASKNKAQINVFAQLSSVVTNLTLFLLTYRYLGELSILLSNSFAYLSSFLVLKYFQHKVNEMNIDKVYALKLLLLFILIFIPCFAIQYFGFFENFEFFAHSVVIISSFIVFLRFLRILTLIDITRYFSTIPIFEKYLKQLLVKKQDL
jgi:O-antigen/teichoic acid export membrane protein